MTLFLTVPTKGTSRIPQFMSFRGSYPYNGIGKFSLVVSYADLRPDFIEKLITIPACLWDRDTKFSWIASNVELDEEACTVTLNGVTANAIANSRSIRNNGPVPSSGNMIPFTITTVASIYQMMHSLTDGYTPESGEPSMRFMGMTVPESSDLANTVPETALLGGQILDAVMPILTIMGYGNKTVFNPEVSMTHTFQIYSGQDRTVGDNPVLFSDTLGNAKNFRIVRDGSAAAIKAIVSAKRSNESRVMSVYRNAIGMTQTPNAGLGCGIYCVSPEELWCTDTISVGAEGMTGEELLTRANAIATTAFKAHAGRESIKCDVDANGFGTAYNLGDIVSIAHSKWNINTSAQITGVQFEIDKDTNTTTLQLGESPISLMERFQFG